MEWLLEAVDELLRGLSAEGDSWIARGSRWLVSRPIAFVLAVALPPLVLSLWKRIHPTSLALRLLVWVSLMAIAAVAPTTISVVARIAATVAAIFVVHDAWSRVEPVPWRWGLRGLVAGAMSAVVWLGAFPAIVAGIDGLLLLLGAIDVLRLPSLRRLEVSRRVLKIASLRKPHDVEIELSNRSGRTILLELKDDLPEDWRADPETFDVRIAPRTKMVFGYRFEAMRRGAFRLECVHLRIASPLGFWWRYERPAVRSDVHVYPDMAQLKEYAILARTNRLSLMGVRRTRRIGQDNEFERLRDYTLDDNYRHIDWRATARRDRLTVKDFQANQSQRLIFLIDCGRMMTNDCEGISLLDHAINSMLMASYVALRQGDSVGVVCFSDRVHSFVPPRGGAGQLNQLLHSVFDRHPTMVESRYDEAFLHLSTHCRKRSLVILITNVVDEVNASQVSEYLSNLVGKHLPLGVLLRDHRIFDRVETKPRNRTELYQAAAAAEILSWRQQVLNQLTRSGVLALDVFPEDMTAPLVNQYLQIKARHLL